MGHCHMDERAVASVPYGDDDGDDDDEGVGEMAERGWDQSTDGAGV